MKSYINLIKKEVELYGKFLKQNNDILDVLQNTTDTDTVETKINNKEKLLNEIREIDNVLNGLWNNWEKYKSIFNNTELDKIKELKQLIHDNLSVENKIIEIMQKKLNSNKSKTIQVSHGRAALTAYQGIKSNLPYFVNKKS